MAVALDQNHTAEHDDEKLGEQVAVELGGRGKAFGQEVDDDVLAGLERVGDALKVRDQDHHLRDFLRPPQGAFEEVAQPHLNDGEQDHRGEGGHRDPQLGDADPCENPAESRQVPGETGAAAGAEPGGAAVTHYSIALTLAISPLGSRPCSSNSAWVSAILSCHGPSGGTMMLRPSSHCALRVFSTVCFRLVEV